LKQPSKQIVQSTHLSDILSLLDLKTEFMPQLVFKSAFALLLFLVSISSYSEIKLPSMGEASSAVISLEQERSLGQAWLRSFRAQADISNDYLIQEYVEGLLFSMVRHSAMEDKRLDVLIVDNPSLNAFAVPGGIIGVNTGLFLYANTEAEFASVLAHELSHISQRHFARSVAERKINAVTSFAGLLAGILLAATAGGDAGLAVLSATQAASLEAGLRYSRQNEQEADRIGMDVLTDAGYDPGAMADMFEGMLRATRYVGYQAPEYLRTHPLTESRVNDALARAQQYPDRFFPASATYGFMQTRIEVNESGSPDQAVRKFQALVENEETTKNRYGLALAYKNALKLSEAKELALKLYQEDPENTLFGLLYSELISAFGETQQAEKIITDYLQRKPMSYPLNMALANTLNQGARFSEAANVLKSETKRRPKDSAVWYEYAETLGLAGEIFELHKARAEYFMLVGAYDRAIRQLQFAKKEVVGKPIEISVIDEKISRAARLRSNSQF